MLVPVRPAFFEDVESEICHWLHLSFSPVGGRRPWMTGRGAAPIAVGGGMTT
jgi:hypothetical protein